MVESNEGLDSLVSKLGGLEKMYHELRVVDPVKKKVMQYKKDSLVIKDETCFSCWANQEICKNCISMRSYNENDTIIKIEHTTDEIFMVMAVPVEINGSRVVVELLKDVTNSMIMNEGSFENYFEMKALLDETNLKAVTDELTGVYNKRYLMEKLPVDLVDSHLKSNNFSIIIADIDYFKIINDTYGHLAGDYILKEFASILRENIRTEIDWIARFGGEEFLVCLTDTDKKAALKIAERMRKGIEDKKFVYDKNIINITSSFGISSLADINSNEYNLLIENADKNLYQAKNNGRNCVICSEG